MMSIYLQPSKGQRHNLMPRAAVAATIFRDPGAGIHRRIPETNGIYRGQSLTYKSEINVQAYCQVRDDFIRAPVDNLKKRFPETDLDFLQSLGQLLESRNFPQADYIRRLNNSKSKNL